MIHDKIQSFFRAFDISCGSLTFFYTTYNLNGSLRVHPCESDALLQISEL